MIDRVSCSLWSFPTFITVEQGKSSKFSPHAQKVSLAHQVQDEDVVSSAFHGFHKMRFFTYSTLKSLPSDW